MMKYILSLTLLFLLFNSCNHKNNKNSITNYLDSSIKTDKNNIPIDSNQFYFPTKIFHNPNSLINIDTLILAWYSKHLRAMKEPLLFNKKENKQIFRFTWLRTFDNPVTIRIEKSQDNIVLSWKLCDGAGGYDPGKMTISDSITVDEETWRLFNKLVNRTHFWDMETVEKDQIGLDGEQWILEGKNEQKYHVVDRWTPTSGAYFDCCNFLIKEIRIDSLKLSEVRFKNDSTKLTEYGLVYILADEYPQFGIGTSDLSKYLSDHLKSYLSPLKYSIDEKVIASFVVFENGSVHDVSILRGIRNDIDSACLKMLNNMPNWTPGKVKGKPVKIQIAIPIWIK
jgi:hypothetical protein